MKPTVNIVFVVLAFAFSLLLQTSLVDFARAQSIEEFAKIVDVSKGRIKEINRKRNHDLSDENTLFEKLILDVTLEISKLEEAIDKTKVNTRENIKQEKELFNSRIDSLNLEKGSAESELLANDAEKLKVQKELHQLNLKEIPSVKIDQNNGQVKGSEANSDVSFFAAIFKCGGREKGAPKDNNIEKCVDKSTEENKKIKREQQQLKLEEIEKSLVELKEKLEQIDLKIYELKNLNRQRVAQIKGLHQQQVEFSRNRILHLQEEMAQRQKKHQEKVKGIRNLASKDGEVAAQAMKTAATIVEKQKKEKTIVPCLPLYEKSPWKYSKVIATLKGAKLFIKAKDQKPKKVSVLSEVDKKALGVFNNFAKKVNKIRTIKNLQVAEILDKAEREGLYCQDGNLMSYNKIKENVKNQQTDKVLGHMNLQNQLLNTTYSEFCMLQKMNGENLDEASMDNKLIQMAKNLVESLFHLPDGHVMRERPANTYKSVATWAGKQSEFTQHEREESLKNKRDLYSALYPNNKGSRSKNVQNLDSVVEKFLGSVGTDPGHLDDAERRAKASIVRMMSESEGGRLGMKEEDAAFASFKNYIENSVHIPGDNFKDLTKHAVASGAKKMIGKVIPKVLGL